MPSLLLTENVRDHACLVNEEIKPHKYFCFTNTIVISKTLHSGPNIFVKVKKVFKEFIKDLVLLRKVFLLELFPIRNKIL